MNSHQATFRERFWELAVGRTSADVGENYELVVLET